MTDDLKVRGLRVKALAWVDGRLSKAFARFAAETPFGTYEAMEWSDGTFGGSMLDGVEFGDLETMEAAKAAAQADYESRILAALEISDDP